MAKYLAIDPGNTTGWAGFTETGDVTTFDDCPTREAVYRLLDEQQPEVIIMEDYRLFPWKAKEQAWSGFETVRVIGAVEYWAWQHGAKIVLQEPNIKSIGYMWAGITKPKNHSQSHMTDAYVHGVYYLQKQKIRKPQQGKDMTK